MSTEPTGWGDTDRIADGAGLATQLEAVRRRKWPMLIAFCTVLVAAIAAVLLWPATYRSMGTILIEQQEVPLDFVRSAVTSYADERVQVISQRVMTSANLLTIIDKYKLYGADRESMTREQLVERMRKDVQLQMISSEVVDPRAGRTTKATIAFAVGYESRSPELAVRVANELVTLYLQKNLETRQQLAAGTAQFLADESEKLRARIAELEQRIAEFKQQNFDRLPEYAQANIQAMNRAVEEQRDVESRIHALDQQIVFLDSQLVQISPTSQVFTDTNQRLLSPSDRLKVLRSERASAIGRYSPEHPDVQRIEREIAALEKEVGGVDPSNDIARRLDEARSQLATDRERYAPDHPDVRRDERLVASLEEQLRNAAPSAPARPRGEVPDNPAYIQITAQREASRNERAALAARRAELQARIAEYERAQIDMPAVERDYGAMLREVQGEQTKYADVRQKLMEAQLAQNLETEQKGERFTLIEPPLQPQEPVRPNRLAILAIGFVLSLGAAVALLLLLEAVDTRIRGRRQVVSLLGVPPLAIIPWVGDDEKPRRFMFWRRQPAPAPAGT